MLLEALKAKRYMDLAGLSRIWVSGGCRPHPPVYSIQPERLHLLRVRLSSRFLAIRAVSSVSNRNQAFYRTALDCFFHYARLSASLFQILCLYRYRIIGFLVPGVVLALWQKRFEIVLLATIPVVGAFIARAIENRLLLPIPFWVILMSFTVAWLLKLRPWPGVQIVVGAVAALILLNGLVPSVRYIYSKTKSPFGIRYYAQQEVAVSRFLRHVVAGQEHPGPPHLEHNEFNRIEGIPDAAYDTFVCQADAYSIIHLFLRDYDDGKILSFCADYPFAIVMSEQDVWNANKRAVLSYVPGSKNLKLIWENDPKTRKDNQNVPIAPRLWNRRFDFIFLWGKNENVLRTEHP